MRVRHLRRNLAIAGTMALAGVVGLASIAAGEPGNGTPEIQVLPSTGLDYRQTVQVKGDDLPEGSGLIAATICGFTDAAGNQITAPTADDCAGADELGRGLVVLQENKDGTFDQPYTLPASGEAFGKNARFCDATHQCAIVLADANPDAPAYYLPQVIQFKDQAGGAPGGPETTTTTAPPPPSASASVAEATIGDTVEVSGEHWVAGDGDTTVGFVDENGAPTTPAVPATVDASGALSATLQSEFDDVDATAIVVDDPTSDPSTHRVTIPITMRPPEGVATQSSAEVEVSQSPRARIESRVIVTPPSSGGDEPPLPEEVSGPIADACAQLADQLSSAGADTTALTTACNSIVNGGGRQLEMLLGQPSLLCVLLAPAVQGNAQFVEACNQALGSDGAGQVTPPVRDALKPALDLVP